jgi:hypothetical protein
MALFVLCTRACNNMSMGVITTRIMLSNPKENMLSPIEVDAIVDTGALHLCIPEHVALQLKLTEMYKVGRQVKICLAKPCRHAILSPRRARYIDLVRTKIRR